MSQQASDRVRITHIGGPTILVEIGQFRILTDPTFDPAGSQYERTMKYIDPALSVSEVGPVDVALVSHDQHPDNLDEAGRASLSQARHVLTTPAGASRLGNGARGMEKWESIELVGTDGRRVHITAVPAHHGPEEVLGMLGDVNGWIVEWEGARHGALYVSGDTVFFDGLREIPRRYPVAVAVLHFGAAQTSVYGPVHLTLTATDGVQMAQALGEAIIIPIHFEGWAHYTEGRTQIEQAFRAAGLEKRLRFLPPGQPVALDA
ncbi:MBL fold metallo-hydrolase [Thermogemmatispora carboxidivorans]|uniref:MBL fold metallo-hydrolase n=1 Tax=Thermogemmatispora carboxidivorans TaxID=1382306 RepID=UPI00069AA65B|nr:MBL fold metallo-hydrolase [Thermogemmatispora carboxidivorans]